MLVLLLALVVMSANSSTATYYFKSAAADSITLTAAATGITTSGNATVTTTPSKFAFTNGSLNTTAGICSSALNIQTQTINGTANKVLANATVDLTGTPGVAFFTDSGCANSATAITVAAATNATSFLGGWCGQRPPGYG